MASIRKMKAAQRLNNIAGVIEGVGIHQGTGLGKAKLNPMKPKRTNMAVNPMPTRRRAKAYNQE